MSGIPRRWRFGALRPSSAHRGWSGHTFAPRQLWRYSMPGAHRTRVRSAAGWFAAPLIMVLTLASGCKTSEVPSARATGPKLSVAPPSLSATPSVGTVSGKTLPIEAHIPTPSEHDVVDQALVKLTIQCMSRFGFTWVQSSIPWPSISPLDRQWGVSDLATARQYGYHIPPSLTGGHPLTSPAAPHPSPVREYSPGFRQVVRPRHRRECWPHWPAPEFGRLRSAVGVVLDAAAPFAPAG